jgi:hypothetical protein
VSYLNLSSASVTYNHSSSKSRNYKFLLKTWNSYGGILQKQDNEYLGKFLVIILKKTVAF